MCRGKLEKHDWVKRVKKTAGGKKQWRLIEVRKCTNEGCHKKHRLIPDDQVPYKHYEEALIEKVIKDELTEEEMLKAEDYPCDETKKRWKVWAEQLKRNAEAHMRLLLIKLLNLTDLLYLEDVSLLSGIQERIPRGWLAAIIRVMVNFGGTGILPEPP